ncbi:MAG: NHL repeat-containing protein [Chloroflexota bacterium]
MHNPVSFTCPRCGAPLQAPGGQLSIECDYCGGTVLVPPDLRPAQPQPPTQPMQINLVFDPRASYGQPTQALPAPAATEVLTHTQQPARPRRRSIGCSSTLVMLVALGLITAGVLWFINSRVPYLFQNLAAGGYARIEQTFSASVDGTELVTDPVDVAVDGKDNIFVADYARKQVVRFDPQGAYLSSWRLGGADRLPSAIAADSAGNVFVVAQSKMLIYEAGSGTLLGTGEVPDIFGVGDICVMPDGSLLAYVSGDHDSLVQFNATGAEIGRRERPISEVSPNETVVTWQARLAAGKDGSLFLLSTSPTNPGVFVYGPDGKYKTQFGTQGDGEGQLDGPNAIAVDGKGRVYVSDWKGVQVFDARGSYIGIIRLPFHGVASGMAFNSNNDLYLVSRLQGKIYKFALNEP